MNGEKKGFIKAQVKRKFPITLAMSRMISKEQAKAEETIHYFNPEEITSIMKNDDGTFQITVKNPPFKNTADFKLISDDPDLEYLTI